MGKLKEKSDGREIDLIVKILKITNKDDYDLELRIKDASNEVWFIIIPKLKFGALREGEIVRIRSVEVNMLSKRNVVLCKPSTNILKFTFRNSIVQEMKQAVQVENTADQMMDDDCETIMSPLTFTEIDYQHENLPMFKLDDLFLNFDNIPLEQQQINLFRIRFYCIRVEP